MDQYALAQSGHVASQERAVGLTCLNGALIHFTAAPPKTTLELTADAGRALVDADGAGREERADEGLGVGGVVLAVWRVLAVLQTDVGVADAGHVADELANAGAGRIA